MPPRPRRPWVLRRFLLCAAAVALPPVALAAPVTALPPEPVVGKVYPVRTEGTSRSVRVTVNNASKVARLGPLKAEPGRAFLVLSTTWENIIPLTDAANPAEQMSTAYKVPSLADMVYLVLDGRRVARLSAAAAKSPGHLPPRDLTIGGAGEQARGTLVFDISDDAHLGQAELRFFDSVHGNLVVPLAEAGAAEPPKPTSSPDRNQILEAAAYGLEKGVKGPRDLPPGMQWVRIDFRAKSLVTTPPPPAAKGKPENPPGQTVADWPDANRYITLLVDRETAYAPQPGPEALPDAPRFLPEVPTGGTLWFAVPQKAGSMELQCTFPGARVGGKVVRPTPLAISLGGAAPAKAALKPLVPPTVDGPFFVAVSRVETPATFADQPPSEGKQFLLVTYLVANTSKTGENFQPGEQLKFLRANGETLAADPLTAAGPKPPIEPLWVPVDARRTFQMLYRIDAAEPAFRLSYAGVNSGAIITLPGGTGQGAVQSAKAPTSGPAIVRTDSGEPPPPPREKRILAANEPLKKGSKSYPSRVSARPNLEAKGLAGVGVTPEKLNAAIDRGAAALWKRIADRLAQSSGSKFGDLDTDKIAALALVHAGYHKKDKTFDDALRAMLAKYDPVKNYQTYENGIICMTIEAYGDTKYVPQLAASAQWILDQQGPEGTWAYGKYVSAENDNDQKTPRKILSIVGGRPPEESAKGTQPLNRRTAAIDYTDGDNSVSQYAVLGLNAASRSGFELPHDSFQTFLKETLARQNDDGGWAYHQYGSSSYGAMTCAGICAVALSKFELGEREPWKDEAIERGLAWLNAYFQIDDHPRSEGQWIFYYLYSLERVGRILDTEFIGDHEWYPLGSKWLVDNQKPTGLWFSPNGNESESRAEIPTSFALLFLTRATPSLGERKIPQGPGTLATAALLPPGNRLYVILDCSGSMLEEMGGRQKFDIAKDAIRSLIKDMPDNSEVALRAYGYRLRAIQPGASEDTKLLVPLKTLDRKEMAGFIDGLRCRGKTPMALSLDEAADDLRSAGTAERPVTVVLLTDGGEDSQPRKDPIAAAAAFAKLENINFRIVGFDINREDWTQQLTAMAKAAGAGYLPATKADELQRELKAAVFGTPDTCTILDAAGKPVQTVQFGQSLQLPPGKYQFQTTFGGQTYGDGFYISPGETTSITFDSSAIADQANAAQAAKNKPAESAPAPAAEKPPVAKPAAKFCKNCGSPLKPGAKFCSSCGAKLGD